MLPVRGAPRSRSAHQSSHWYRFEGRRREANLRSPTLRRRGFDSLQLSSRPVESWLATTRHYARRSTVDKNRINSLARILRPPRRVGPASQRTREQISHLGRLSARHGSGRHRPHVGGCGTSPRTVSRPVGGFATPCPRRRRQPLRQDSGLAVARRVLHIASCSSSPGVLPVAGANLVTSPSDPRVVHDSFHRTLDFTHVLLSLIVTPAITGVIPYLFQVGACGGRKHIPAHRWKGSSRLRATNSSKSNGVDSPLRSPTMSAWRNARNWVSRSSSNRRAVRTTSLADR